MKTHNFWLIALLGTSLVSVVGCDDADDNDIEDEGIQEPGSSDAVRRGCGTKDLDPTEMAAVEQRLVDAYAASSTPSCCEICESVTSPLVLPDGWMTWT